MKEVNVYLNFVLNAILGKLPEADALMRAHSRAIGRVAALLRSVVPFESTPLYRGMLLDPAKPFELDPIYTFLSWSEDRDVATWFASPHTYISQPTNEVFNHKLRGFLATEAAVSSSLVIWHHTWVEVFGGVEGVADLALQHPFMGADGRRQIAWSLSTQREVITRPMQITPVAIDDLDEHTIETLDRRLSPSWVAL